jgi:hypothetical protein
MSEDAKTTKNFKFLDITSKLVLIYLLLKLIVFPIVQTGINIVPNLINQEKIATENIKIPDLTFPDISLLVMLFLIQPQTAEILKQAAETLKSVDLSPTGLKAEFKELVDTTKKEIVDTTKKELDELQQRQIEALAKEQKEIDKLQQFMYRLLLTPKEVEKLKGLKEHSENNTTFDFYVNREAAAELRRLRDSELIIVKPPFRYISELEKASNYAKTDKDFIDLTQYCQLTKSGEEFLVKLEEMTKQNYEDNSSIQ